MASSYSRPSSNDSGRRRPSANFGVEVEPAAGGDPCLLSLGQIGRLASTLRCEVAVLLLLLSTLAAVEAALVGLAERARLWPGGRAAGLAVALVSCTDRVPVEQLALGQRAHEARRRPVIVTDPTVAMSMSTPGVPDGRHRRGGVRAGRRRA